MLQVTGLFGVCAVCEVCRVAVLRHHGTLTGKQIRAHIARDDGCQKRLTYGMSLAPGYTGMVVEFRLGERVSSSQQTVVLLVSRCLLR